MRLVQYVAWMVVLVLLILLAWNAEAEPESAAQAELLSNISETPGVETDLLRERNGWDIWHARISSTIANSVDRVDQFFGDERLDDENRRTRLHASTGLKYDRDGNTSLLTDLKLRLALPQLENRLQIFVDEFFTAEELDDADSILEAVKKSEPDTGLRYIFAFDEQRSINTDTRRDRELFRAIDLSPTNVQTLVVL